MHANTLSFNRTAARLKRTGIALLLLSSLPLGACISIGEPERTDYSQPRITGYVSPSSPNAGHTSWSEILKQPAKLRFEVLHTGRVRVPRSGMLNLEHAKLRDGNDAEDREMYVDVFAFRFCHRSAGCFLIDSGLDASFRPEQGGNISGMLAGNYIKGTQQEPGQDIAARLAAPERARLAWPGQSPELRGVFFTHLHGDHSSGVPALPKKNIRYIAGKNEPYINYFLLYYSNHLAGVRELEEIDFQNAQTPELAPLGPAVDLFGDGSAWALATPGHSSGHVSYLLVTTQGPVLLTGDASHTRWGFENGVEPGWHHNREQMRDSLARLIQFARDYPEVQIIYGHER